MRWIKTFPASVLVSIIVAGILVFAFTEPHTEVLPPQEGQDLRIAVETHQWIQWVGDLYWSSRSLR